MTTSASRPNIIYILADDMGYGDVRHLNPQCAFATPHLDQLCQGGMHCTDAHSSSAVCTPSRYSILTGRSCWRTWLKSSVLWGAGAPLIEPTRMTLASMTRSAGYRTTCIGKWHMGWNWAVKPGREAEVNTKAQSDHDFDWIDFTRPITNGPTTVGFDSFYGISGSLDMPPYVYVDNAQPVEVPTAWGTAEEFFRAGPRMESIRANNVLSHITDKVVDYIGQQSAATPFFVYVPLTAPHTPIAPAAEFVGKSGVSPYADFCMEVDARVGQMMAALKAQGLADNTLVIFTSDNGASAGPIEAATLERNFNHYSSYHFRGYKSDIWEGGHRIPFILHWPQRIAANTACATAVGIYDIFATVAELLAIDVPASAGEDSVSFAPLFDGAPAPACEQRPLIHHSIDGRFAIRRGAWKLCRCPGSGGWTLPDAKAREQGLGEIQLYHLERDPHERHNLADEHPDLVEQLTLALHRAVISGRTTPGPAVANDPTITIKDWQQLVWRAEIPEQFVLDD